MNAKNFLILLRGTSRLSKNKSDHPTESILNMDTFHTHDDKIIDYGMYARERIHILSKTHHRDNRHQLKQIEWKISSTSPIEKLTIFRPRPMGHVLTMEEARQARINRMEEEIKDSMQEIKTSISMHDTSKASQKLWACKSLIFRLEDSSLREKYEKILSHSTLENQIARMKREDTIAKKFSEAEGYLKEDKLNKAEKALEDLQGYNEDLNSTQQNKLNELKNRLEENKQTKQEAKSVKESKPTTTTTVPKSQKSYTIPYSYYDDDYYDEDEEWYSGRQKDKKPDPDICPKCGHRANKEILDHNYGEKTVGAAVGAVAGLVLMPFFGILGPLGGAVFGAGAGKSDVEYTCPNCGHVWRGHE